MITASVTAALSHVASNHMSTLQGSLRTMIDVSSALPLPSQAPKLLFSWASSHSFVLPEGAFMLPEIGFKFSTMNHREDWLNIAWRLISEFFMQHAALVITHEEEPNTKLMESKCLPFEDRKIAGA